MTSIAQPSVASLHIEMTMPGLDPMKGTGFVVERNNTKYLVTNRHNLSGRNPFTNQPVHPTGALPTHVVIYHNVAGTLGSWVTKIEPLYDQDGVPLWYKHPTIGHRADVVALPLTDLQGVEAYPYDPWTPGPAVARRVSHEVSIIGFPFGMSGGGRLAIWVRGTVATEPDIDFWDLPVFLVDSRTRPGQSGSPVIAYYDGGMVPMEDGSAAVFGGPVWRLLGVYSGRINEESDLGMVWKSPVVQEVIEGEERGSA